MITAPFILDEQLSLLDRQAEWRRASNGIDPAVLSREMDDLIALALETLERIKKRAASLPVAEVLGYFERWHGIATRALVSVEQVERNGRVLDRSDDFRFAINEASIAQHADEIAAARRRMADGRGVGLDEIHDAVPPKA